MTEKNPIDELDTHSRLNYETAEIAWKELQLPFAQGRVIHVGPSLDLVDVAVQVANDNKALIEPWMEMGQIKAISDEQAKLWLSCNSTLWAVVVKPWVLVQE